MKGKFKMKDLQQQPLKPEQAKDDELRQLRAELDEKNLLIQRMENTFSWKITKPLRILRNLKIFKCHWSYQDASWKGKLLRFCAKTFWPKRLILQSGLFDQEYYLKHNPDVAQAGVNPLRHFLRHGGLEGRNPHPNFDSAYYLRMYRDVKRTGMNPLLHYILYGKQEDRCISTVKGNPSQLWIAQNKPTQAELRQQRRTQFAYQPKISVLTPIYNTPKQFLIEMIESVQAQTYSNWELCLVDGGSTEPYIREILETYAHKDQRIKIQFLPNNLGIAENSNKAAALAAGEFWGLLDHDDLLTPSALFEVAQALNQYPEIEFLYSDEARINEEGEILFPFFKPDWSPDLLRSQNYLCHFVVFKKSLFERIGGFRDGFQGSQDYDLFLRMTEVTPQIHHLAHILYYWRDHNTSLSSGNAQAQVHHAGLKAIEEHLDRYFGKQRAWVESDQEHLYVYDVRYVLPAPAPKVSIIIPTKDKIEFLRGCVQSILSQSSYTNYEILLLDNNSGEKETLLFFEQITQAHRHIRVIEAQYEFNWSRLNNHGIREATGDVFIFLNNDTSVISADWIERLAEQALRKEVGAVGPLLLYHDHTIQHAGIVVGMGGWADHVYKGMPPIHQTQHGFVSPMVRRNVLALTGSCFAISRSTLEKLGGFNEEFTICGSDVEMCIRAYKNGLVNIYDPTVKLYHFEGKTRTSFIPDRDFALSARYYSPFREDGDPYFNRNLSLESVIPAVKNMHVLKENAVPVTSSELPELTPIRMRKSPIPAHRLNLLLPSINAMHTFGGVATALALFQALIEKLGTVEYRYRIIALDAKPDAEALTLFQEYRLVAADEDVEDTFQILSIAERYECIPVWEQDIFIATIWWSAYHAKAFIRQQADSYKMQAHKLIYLIQDFEPGFYPWSSRYVLAESTYQDQEFSTIAICNSEFLLDYLHSHNYHFYKSFVFQPQMNKTLKHYLPQLKAMKKVKRILVYGRPQTPRNCFEIISDALKIWAQNQPDVREWTIISLGEKHPDIDIAHGVRAKSLGKVSLEQYADFLSTSAIGISLMVSPHPSYPPLEMAHFGVLTITNGYANKDLSLWHENITSLNPLTPHNVAEALLQACHEFEQDRDIGFKRKSHIPFYLDEALQFPFIDELIYELE